MKKKTKLGEYIKKFKELWAIPRYRAIIKLSLYGIMFLLIIIMANISSSMNSSNNEKEETKSYTEIIKLYDLDNALINYNLKINDINYKLEGKVQNNILNGYLDNNTEIRKITIKENNIYEIKNNEEIINEKLNTLLNAKLLIPKNIIELVKRESAYINKGKEETTYTFEINDNNIKYEVLISINNEEITNIKAYNENFEYNLLVDFDKQG